MDASLTECGFTLDERLAAALRGNDAARFLATRDRDGRPYLVPALSAQSAEGGLIRFAAIFPAAVERNLALGGSLALLVVDEKLRWWSLAGRLEGFADGAAGEAVRRWGRLRPTGLLARGEPSTWGLVAEYSLLRLFGIPRGDGYADTLPREVALRLQTLQNVKGIAFVDAENRLIALPCQSLRPAGPGAVVCGTWLVPELRRVPPLARVAICVLTFEPNAYQIHGCFEGIGGGLLRTAATIRVSGLQPALA
ncbi:MAG: hypothetical protein GX444_18415 [Myxococcales bacterium]|nr:hypothetical protein [Myxococcales bacterium]